MWDPWPGIEPMSLHDVLTAGPPGKSLFINIFKPDGKIVI